MRNADKFVVDVAAPPGRELYRFATVNDIHIGETEFGFPTRYAEADDVEPYPVRCLRAALAEAKEWGAERILAKGDLTDHGWEEEFEMFALLLAESGLPSNTILGNHDIRDDETDGVAVLRRRGLDVASTATAIDVPGLRIVMLPSASEPHAGSWSASDTAATIEFAADHGAAVFVATHHYPQRFNVANEFPPGIPVRQTTPLLDGLDRVAPRSLIACGHTHRHHRRHYKSLLITEIGSTKDFPGVWAGYVVYEGGITQTVHRVVEPSAREWTDRTGKTLLGGWRWWSPGLRSHRCWSWSWES
ncbi:MAG: 3,5-cyclic-AMP phosphodiesterase [Actinomycetota bacterium]